MRAFVTGATGILGSQVIIDLLAKQIDVVALVRDARPDSRMHSRQVDTVHGELSDYQLIERTINEYEVDVIFHLGAQTIVGTANRSPISTFDSNIKGTWNVLEAARLSEMEPYVIVASSDKAYGQQLQLKSYIESMPMQGRYPYDCSKSCADLLAQCYMNTYPEMNISVARCGNIYGPGDLNYNRLIPGTIKSVIQNKNPVIRSDGKSTRDYLYVADASKAYLSFITTSAGVGHAFNFGGSINLSALDVVNRILSQMDCGLAPEIMNEAVNEIRHQSLDSDKADRILGWKPTLDFDAGLAETISWYKGVLG